MRTIKIGSHTLPVMYAGINPVSHVLKAQIYYGTMTLVKLARILDGKDRIEYQDGDHLTVFEGYTRLTRIEYVDDETIAVFLEKLE